MVLSKLTSCLTEANATLRLTAWCGFWSVMEHYWPIFLWKWGRLSQLRPMDMLTAPLFMIVMWPLSGFKRMVQLATLASHAIIDLLRQTPNIDDHLISRNGGVIWSPKSCDLIFMNYFLWSAIEENCYADKLEKIEYLQDSKNCTKIFPIEWGNVDGSCGSHMSYANKLVCFASFCICFEVASF